MAIQTLRTVLAAAGAVTALVPAERITPLIRPQSIDLPSITLQRVSQTPVDHLRGESNLDSNQVQLDVWADSYATARSIADACRTAGVAANHRMTFEGDGYEPDTDPELYRITQTWAVWT